MLAVVPRLELTHSLGDARRGRPVRSRNASASCTSPAQKLNVTLRDRSRNTLT